jgi:crotonobetainyl-CoA:carnitine CoA-transferase CaiB-like acyl-CoA transferase
MNDALRGLKVIEVAHALAGPFCGVLMADFGADVIKVESPDSGDMMRSTGRIEGLWFCVENRNKKCITLNLKVQKGKEILSKLLGNADILLQNFRPGVLEKLGFSWAKLQKINPRLILVNISGYGQSGPYVNRPAFDRIGMALGGLSHVTGFPDGPPIRPGLALTDYMSGMFGAIGAMFAVYSRDVVGTGKGQIVDASLYESVLRIMETAVVEYGYDGVIKGRTGNAHMATIPSGHYLTKDNQYVALAVAGDNLFATFADVIGRPELKYDDKFKTATGRFKNRAELEEITEKWAKDHTIDECINILGEEIPCSKIYNVEDMFKDPHLAFRNNILKIGTKIFGEIYMQGIVPKLSGTPGEVKWAGLPNGSSNEEVFINELKMTKNELEKLKAEGII